jgi:hypothetical protein
MTLWGREAIEIMAFLIDCRWVVEILVNIIDDDEVVGHAVMALGKLRAETARGRIEALLGHPTPWIRDEAKKALEQIDQAG